ncbi:MAG TPA: hypothetical protein VGR47_19925 [Terracidiphilus sp.]|nr:hypothetical protein [Terracidiphilus sp.]
MPDQQTIAKELGAIRKLAREYFGGAINLWNEEHSHSTLSWGEADAFISGLPPNLAEKLGDLESQIAAWASRVVPLARTAPLMSGADQGELRLRTREMMAALRFREYQYNETRLLSWEDQVYGVEPASQNERETLPQDAVARFGRAADEIQRLLLLVQGQDSERINPVQMVPQFSGAQLRRDTAFIMMWMSDEHPELEDVKQGIKEVFGEFGVSAIRADEIEHEGVITERILQEISSAEFLIADLTGARPNVYYEIGYAHALGKRPILYRKRDAVLHFDLAGRNVPSYSNVSELKRMLRTRLEALVGFKSAKSKREEVAGSSHDS